MIDFHTHILYDIDDGPPTIDESIQMAKMAYNDGTRTIVATPHAPGLGGYSVAKVHNRVAALREALAEVDIPIEILPSSELFYDADLVENLKAGTLLSCNNTRTILVECPIYEQLPPDFHRVIDDVQRHSYRVVLAHPERIRDVMDDPNTVLPLIERGILMQITSQALTGEQGLRMKDVAEVMLQHNMVHVIASDAHRPTYRPPILSDAVDIATALIGDAAVQALVYDNPRALLDDAPLMVPEPRRC